jgi:hypothetical protein
VQGCATKNSSLHVTRDANHLWRTKVQPDSFAGEKSGRFLTTFPTPNRTYQFILQLKISHYLPKTYNILPQIYSSYYYILYDFILSYSWQILCMGVCWRSRGKSGRFFLLRRAWNQASRGLQNSQQDLANVAKLAMHIVSYFVNWRHRCRIAR